MVFFKIKRLTSIKKRKTNNRYCHIKNTEARENLSSVCAELGGGEGGGTLSEEGGENDAKVGGGGEGGEIVGCEDDAKDGGGGEGGTGYTLAGARYLAA